MKASQLRELGLEELREKEKKLQEELFKLNQKRFEGKVDKPHMFKLLRKDIARIKTVINEKLKIKS
jgi:large subunit ribosomal protein L29